MTLVLSRVRLKREPAVDALARLLMPRDRSAAAAGHHIVWSLFADAADRTRDFLWREESPGRYLTLSARAPRAMDLFEVESRPFEPALAPGDRLGFTLRCNATIDRMVPGERRSGRHDVVMDALRSVPKDARAEQRLDHVVQAGRGWLARQGAVHGFRPEPDVGVDGYDRVKIQRDGGKPAVFGVLEFSGVLRVEDPERFLAALARGFGRARAYGYGLMLIRRAGPAE